MSHSFRFLPHQVKTQYLHFRFHATCFLLPWKIPDNLADDKRSSITKDSIYHIKHMYIQPFTTVVDWPEIGCLMEVSTLFYILQILRFYLWGQIQSGKCEAFLKGWFNSTFEDMFIETKCDSRNLNSKLLHETKEQFTLEILKTYRIII